MENVIYDMYIAEAIIENDYINYNEPEEKEALIDQVLKKHKISEARWDTSLSWYSDKIDVYLQINDSVKSRILRVQKNIEDEQALLAAINSSLEEKGPDYIPLHFRIATLGCNRGFKFNLDSTQLAERFGEKDTLFFRFKLIGVYPVDSYSLKSMLKIDYADTTIYQGTELNENKSYSFPLIKSIDKDTISSVHGFVNLSGEFPQVPIQLHQISLSAGESKKDSLINEMDSIGNKNDSVVSEMDSIEIKKVSTVNEMDSVGIKKDGVDSIKQPVEAEILQEKLKMTTD